MRIIELRQHLLDCFCVPLAHLSVVELLSQFNITLQHRRGTPTRIALQDIDQHLFVGCEVGNNVLHRPSPTCSWLLPFRFWQTIDGLQCCALSIFQNVPCVHACPSFLC